MKEEFHPIHRGRIALNVTLQVIAVVAVLIAANYYAFNNFVRWDVSRRDGHDLSAQTRNLLKKLKDEVKIIVVFQPQNVLLGDVLNLLKEYQYASDKKVTVEVVHAATAYQRALELKRDYEFELNEEVLIVDVKGRHKIISAHRLAEFDTSGLERGLRPRITSFLGERVVTSALLELLEGKPAVVYVAYGHGEPEPTPGGELSGILSAITRQNIEVRPLVLNQARVIPEDADAVILTGPQVDLNENAVSALTAYWAQGGRLMIFLWNGAETPSLRAFLAGRGVFPREDQVIVVVKQGVAVNKVRDVVAMPSVEHPVTRRYKDLAIILRGRTQSLALGNPPPDGLRISALLTSQRGAGYWGETDALSVETDRLPVYDRDVDAAGELVLAAAVEQAGPTDERIKSSSGRLIVVGNAFCLYNPGLTPNVQDFVLSGVNWLLNRADLVGISAKQLNEFPPNLTDEQLASIMWSVVFGIPGVAMLLAIIVWLVRRR